MRILILYNARSGHRKVNFSAYLNALAHLGADIETRIISRRFNLEDLLKDAQSFDRIVVAGGDGTVSTAAGILKNSGLPIVAYPGGTANLLARNLGMPSNPEQLAEITLNGRAIPTDLGEIEYTRYLHRDILRRRFLKRPLRGTPEKIYFSIMAGYGFAARLMSQARRLKSKWGEAAYWLSASSNLYPPFAKFRLVLDGKEVEAGGIGILIVNFEKIQFDLKVVPGSVAQDGKFEIFVVKARNLFGLIPLLWGALHERLGFPNARKRETMETYQASQIEITSKPPLKLQFDGEILKKTSSFKIGVCQGAARFVYGVPS